MVDLDKRIAADGEVDKEALEIVAKLPSYWETSPSGTGLHGVIRGQVPGDRCRAGIEIYDGAKTLRFMSATGNRLPAPWSTEMIQECAAIDEVYTKMIQGAFKEPEKAAMTSQPAPAVTSSVQIESTGTSLTSKRAILFSGEIISQKPFVIRDDSGELEYESQSQADQALANLLALEHKGDIIAIDADFRESSLFRKKWNRQDYRDATIKKAVAFYNATRPQSQVSSVDSSVDEDESIVEIDTSLPEFPKFTGSLADMCDAMSPDIPRAFLFTAALTHLGLIRSGLDSLELEPHLQPRFYSIFVAPPGRGKSASINEVRKLFSSLGATAYCWPSVDSSAALVDTFYDANTQALIRADGNEQADSAARVMLDPDEITDIFEKGKTTVNSRNPFMIELLRLFEGNSTGNRARGAKTKIRIHNAHLAILGGATESGYQNMWTGISGSATGLQSRITLSVSMTAKCPRYSVNLISKPSRTLHNELLIRRRLPADCTASMTTLWSFTASGGTARTSPTGMSYVWTAS